MDGFTASHRGGSGPPLVLVHGFTDTWRTWELVLPALERRHEVLAVTLPGHAGGPPIAPELEDDGVLADAVERAMDDAGFELAHIVGNSLGGYVALHLGVRGRAQTVTAIAPAGGWARGGDSDAARREHFTTTKELATAAAPHADAIAGAPEGRRRATQMIAEQFEHIPADLIAHQIRAVAACDAVEPLLALTVRSDFEVDVERIGCPVRIVWGTADRLLNWPDAAVRYQAELPHADWVVLDGVGHCPQLDVPLETAELILGFTSN